MCVINKRVDVLQFSHENKACYWLKVTNNISLYKVDNQYVYILLWVSDCVCVFDLRTLVTLRFHYITFNIKSYLLLEQKTPCFNILLSFSKPIFDMILHTNAVGWIIFLFVCVYIYIYIYIYIYNRYIYN